MDEGKLYEEDYLENPGRRKFLGDAIIIGSSVLLASLGIGTACKNPTGNDIDDFKPATEEEGKLAMKDAADAVMGEKGYTYEIKYDFEVYVLNTNERGWFDAVVFADTDGNGQYDLRLGMNYVTEGESRQNLQDTARYKFKEIVKSNITTKEYLTKEFEKWMRDVA